ncbi:unnamed protein product [Brassica napus]|uniref:(rape) hypothetical protein n=1 Tax=Brassica napus TaxID=3708 RepID=A0A816ML47_BRANA|nr:unnamed protein product [Brassica napus]
MYCHSSPTLLTLQFIININRYVCCLISISKGLLETIYQSICGPTLRNLTVCISLIQIQSALHCKLTTSYLG